MQADLMQSLSVFGLEKGTTLLILDPYHPDGFPAGEFLFGEAARALFDEECIKAIDTGEMDRLIVIAGKTFGDITQTHAGSSAETLEWIEEFERWAMSKRRSLSILAFIERPELKEKVDALIERSKDRDKFNQQFKIKRTTK